MAVFSDHVDYKLNLRQRVQVKCKVKGIKGFADCNALCISEKSIILINYKEP